MERKNIPLCCGEKMQPSCRYKHDGALWTIYECNGCGRKIKVEDER